MTRQTRTIDAEHGAAAVEEYYLVTADDMAVLRDGLIAARAGRFEKLPPAEYERVMRAGVRMDHVWGDRPRTLQGVVRLAQDMARGRR